MDPALVAVTDVLATTPGVMFSVKSVDGRYLAANRAFAERAGVAGPGEVVGRTARDLFPAELADAYEAQDRSVIETGKMLSNELELITRQDGVGWFLTSKSRWVEDGQVAGLVSVSVDLKAPDDAATAYPNLSRAVAEARRRFREQVTVADLAEAADLTTAQLERLSRRVLGLTPKQLVMRFRLEDALSRLAISNDSIGAIAASCGYYDQSSFTSHFKRVVGCTPSQWRKTQTAG